jgi:HlyD family secretion protein
MAGQLTIYTAWDTVTADGDARVSFPPPLAVRAPITGIVGPLQLSSGSKVTEGRVIAEISNPDRANQLAGQIQSAELRIQQARLGLQDTQKQQAERIEDSELRTPISGIAVLPFQPALVGEQLPQGYLVATVIDYHRMRVLIPVDELDVAKVEPGQRVLLAADALPRVSLTGRVSHVSLQGKGQGGVATFDVTVELDPNEELRVGMTVHADIQVELRQATLLVPIEAVQYQDGKSFIDVVEADTGRGQQRTRRVEVITGANDLTRIEILSGLEEGWQVLIPSPPASLPEFGPGGGGGGFGNGFQQEGER